MRKIKYKKGKKVQPSYLEYTGSHKSTKTELQLFVYDSEDIIEYDNFMTNHLSYKENNVDLHNNEVINAIYIIMSRTATNNSTTIIDSNNSNENHDDDDENDSIS